MKKLLVIAIALASVNAQASRARINALGNSPHLIDTQTIYENPAHMFYVGGDFVAIESGTTASTAQNANTEGLVVRSLGDAKLGLSLGHQSKNASGWGLRALAPANLTAPANKNQQNPLEISYGMKTGDMAWGATLVYSNYNDKLANEKESSMGVRAGIQMGALDVQAGLGLGNTLETAATKFTGTMGMNIGAGYVIDTMYVFGNFVNAGAKLESAAGAELAKLTSTEMEVGIVNSHKKDNNEFFYGVKLASGELKESVGDDKTTTLSLPIWLGLEVDANSWLTFRGSVQQATLISQSKDTTGATTNSEFAPGANNTTANMGVGLKFNNKLTLDGTLSTATTQTINTSALMAQAGLTYMF